MGSNKPEDGRHCTLAPQTIGAYNSLNILKPETIDTGIVSESYHFFFQSCRSHRPPIVFRGCVYR